MRAPLTCTVPVTEATPVTLTRVRRLSSSTLDFRFVTDSGEALSYQPGQFFRFVFTDADGEFERSYSLCNFEAGSAAPGVMDLLISTVEGGRASRLLFSSKPGLQAKVTGPFGRLLIPDPLPQRLIVVATSVGIAPYMPMLDPLVAAAQRGETTIEFLFGARDPSEFLYAGKLKQCHAADGFNLSLCYSRAMPPEPADFEMPGYVTGRLEALAPEPATDKVLLCGNPAMVDDCFEVLRAAGFRGKQVIREKYVFAREKKSTGASPLSDEQKRLIAEKASKYQ